MSEHTYPIHERFATWQGEGVHMGRKAFFIRTLGCPVKCPFCDSAGTWHPKWVPKEKNLMSVGQLMREVFDADPQFIVVTGGEPAIWDLEPLCHAAAEAGYKIHIETSGGFELRGSFNWITVSPKRWKPLLESCAGLADEFKVIVTEPKDIQFYIDMIDAAIGVRPLRKPIWLHPEWSQRNNHDVLDAICEAVGGKDARLRAGYQLHKLYKVDALDERTRQLVPLGGDRKNGF